MTYRIGKAAIIGAGTMGAGIAAHLANLGIPVLLLDIPTPGLSAAEQGDSQARNRLVTSLFERMVKARPANLARADRAELITLGNTEDDLDKIADADWIIEVIIEQLTPKQVLMARIEALRKPGSIISSNTSGIPIHQIVEGRSDDFRKHFLGTHFFNPPRYLKLLELIPTPDTDPEVLSYMVSFGEDVLGKGVVICKDTPNFIANRFFTIAASYAIEYALANGYSVPEIDAITGPVIGRPKSASYRLMDLVGLDIMTHVNNNLYAAIPHDYYREVLKGESTAAVVEPMLANKWLGNKSGQGFYKEVKVNGSREFWALNPTTMDYEAAPSIRFDSIGAVRKLEDLGARLKALLEHEDRAACYIRDTLFYGFAYAAEVAPEIAYKLSDIDDAMRWGFAHEAGPFEMWDMLGVAATAQQMEAAGYKVAGWVKQMLAAGHTSFYQNGSVYDFNHQHTTVTAPDLTRWSIGQQAATDTSANESYGSVGEAMADWVKTRVSGAHPSALPQNTAQSQPRRAYTSRSISTNVVFVKDLYRANKEVVHSHSASLLDMGDGVALLEFHAKMNAIDPDIRQMADCALERLNTDFDALVIGNNGPDFSVGANIALVCMAAAQGEWGLIDQEACATHETTFRLRHAPKPVVTAPHQRVLGGGVEFSMAGWTAVANHETYMGLVEVGVGIIPAAGGCKELLRRKVNPVMRTPNADVLPVLQDVFTQVATAQVGSSAWEARSMGYLTESDTIVMNSDQRLARAKQKALQLVASGARPPEVEKVYAAGRDALAVLRLGIQSMVWGGYASEHDALVAGKLAYVLCGGELSAPAWVDPWYILDLEREALLSLLGEEKTRDRMMHMLQTGKPLRN